MESGHDLRNDRNKRSVASVAYLIVHPGLCGINAVEMVHLYLGAVPFPLLVMLGWNLDIDVTQEPPVGKALREVDAAEPTTTRLWTSDSQLGRVSSNGLNRL